MAERSNIMVQSNAETAWWQSADEATGAFSPLAGSLSEVIVGTISALAERGLAIKGMEPGNLGRIYEAQDADGCVWFVRWLGNPFWKAFRDRTDQEIAKEIETREDLTTCQLRKSTVFALRSISAELVRLGEGLRPEVSPSRNERRALKARILSLARTQDELACSDPPGRFTRVRMTALGLGPRNTCCVGRLNARQ